MIRKPSSNLHCVIITGYPGSGKTSLAKIIAPILGLPLVCRDDLKELLFDTLGSKDRDWSSALGGAAYELLWQFADSLFAAGCHCMLESNFTSRHSTTALLKFHEKYGTQFIQVVLHAPPKLLLSRFSSRWERGERHAGHCDDVIGEEFARLVEESGVYSPLELPGSVIQIDTQDFDKIDHQQLCKNIQGFIRHGQAPK